jgi:molecular chaperone GrpE
MPDEHRIDPSEPEPPAQAEPSAPSEQTEPPAPDDAAPEPEPSTAPQEAPDAAGGNGAGGAGATGEAAGEAGAGEADADGDVSPDATELEEAVRQRDAHYERLLRVTAEFDNYRKRVERERAALASAAAADLIEELLPVIDNLERALDAPVAEASAAAYRDGVELIHRQMLDLLRKRGVTPIETAGQVFDPNLHQAIAHEESGEHGPGEIIGEVRRGYLVGSRLLRASMVRVART